MSKTVSERRRTFLIGVGMGVALGLVLGFAIGVTVAEQTTIIA